MAEFRARLRAPKPEYVLGAIIESVDTGRTTSGMGFARTGFSNYPFFTYFNYYDAEQLRGLYLLNGFRASDEQCVPIVGEMVNLYVKWQMSTDFILRPLVHIDVLALVEARMEHLV